MKQAKNFLEREKTTGGTSAINAMTRARGAKEDFDRWANRSGAKGWAHANLMKDFQEVETADPDIKPDTEDMESLRRRQGPLEVCALPRLPSRNPSDRPLSAPGSNGKTTPTLPCGLAVW